MKPSNTNPKSATASRDFCSPPVDMGTVTVFLEGTGNKSRGIVAEGLFFFKKRFSHAVFHAQCEVWGLASQNEGFSFLPGSNSESVEGSLSL